MLSTAQIFLMRLSFALLFVFMLLYWVEAALFPSRKDKNLNNSVFTLSFASLTTMLVLRWAESGHFPLSNLYESLLFLSWGSLLALLVLQLSCQQAFVGQSEIKSRRKEALVASGINAHGLNRAQLKIAAQKNEYDLTRLLGVIVSPLAFISYTFAFVNLPKEMQKATSLVPALQSNWLMMHVTVMILSYAALLCGSVLSMAFLFIRYTQKGILESKASIPLSTPEIGGTPSTLLKTVQETVINLSIFARPKNGLTDTVLINTSNRNGTGNSDLIADDSELDPDTLFLKEDIPKHQPNQSTASAFSSSVGTSGVGTSGMGTLANELVGEARESFLDKTYKKERSLCDKLDNLSYRMLGLGFPLLTVGILSGAVWANSAWGSYWSWDPKETWALITWLVFAIYLHSRITKGWSGERPAMIATAGFFVVWFCYLGVNLLGAGLHSYGWFSQ